MRLSNETVKRVVVSTATIGDRLRLCSVRPYYEYVNGTRTDTIVGYAYTVTCSALLGERLDVKIPGKQLVGEESYDHLAKFSNLSWASTPPTSRGSAALMPST